MKDIDIEYAKSILEYNSNTGLFTRKISSGKGKTGSIAGHIKTDGYVQMYIKSERISGHRLAWAMHYGKIPINRIDHINCIPSDNRIINLRECTQSQNSANSLYRSNNKSGYKGVSWHKKSKKWAAQIGFNMKVIKLGYFDDIEEAAQSYSLAAKKYFGDFAKTNYTNSAAVYGNSEHDLPQ